MILMYSFMFFLWFVFDFFLNGLWWFDFLIVLIIDIGLYKSEYFIYDIG